MDTAVLSIDTGRGRVVFDLTKEVASFVAGKGDGLLSVFVPHATAALALMETGSGSEADFLDVLDRLLPRDDRWRHRHGAVGHGADHLVPALLSSGLTIPVVEGRMALGTWQSVVLIDTNVDNPRRSVRLSFVPG
ncbi:MAG TPA: secondary thiamine-phosphate synthase enzyme YjbQ [Acidimicrobiia bacterium]